MTEEQTISWIFLSIAIASQKEATDLNGIALTADYINHCIPNQKELQNSISWLLKNVLIFQSEKKYQLTNLGKSEYEKASENTHIIFKIWNNLELRIIKLKE